MKEYKRIGEYSKKSPSIENCKNCFDCLTFPITNGKITELKRICDVTGDYLENHLKCPYWN